MSDPLSPAALAQVPKVRDAWTNYRMVRAGYRGSVGCQRAQDIVIAAIRDAVLSAERQRLLGMTPEAVVEAAAKAMAESREYDWATLAEIFGVPTHLGKAGLRDLVRAALPILLSAERARSWELIDKMSAAKLAAEAERDRLKAALGNALARYEGTTCSSPEDDHAAASECIEAFRAALSEEPR